MNMIQGLDMQAMGDNGEGEQYLTFMLAGEEYGVDILRVQEIKGWDNVTPIPNTPSYIKGVINLRGTIVPIIDLRERFSLETISYGPTTVVIVLKVNSDKGSRTMGIVVDAVRYFTADMGILSNNDYAASKKHFSYCNFDGA